MDKIKVIAKAQNRTALGIMHAYMVMFPESTLEDLRRAFPLTINPDRGVDQTFIYADQQGSSENWNGFFKNPDELLTLADGRKVAVETMWTKPSLERLLATAKKFGIVAAPPADGEKIPAPGFRIEYLNGWEPKPKPEPEPQPKKKGCLFALIPLLLPLAACVAIAVCLF